MLAAVCCVWQEIVGSLVTHIGSGVRSEVRASLDILVLLVENSVSKMAPFAVFIKVCSSTAECSNSGHIYGC